MNQTKYNGWTNYETWLLALNLNNSPGIQHEAVRSAKDSEDFREFKEYIEELVYDEEKDIYQIEDRWLERDWQEINFYEVWQSFLDS